MMQYGGRAGRRLEPVLEAVELEYSPPCSYRDSIRRVSVSGGLCRSADFFPQSDGVAAGGGGFSWSSSSASSASSSTLYTSSPCYGRSISDDDDQSSTVLRPAVSDGVHELRAIAHQMVDDGYIKDLLRAFGGGLLSVCDGGPGRDELLLERWFSELDVEWVLLLHTEEERDVARLRLEDGCIGLQNLMERWIRALLTMVHVLCFTQLELRAKRSTVRGVRKAIQYFVLLATNGTLAAAREAAEREKEVAQFERFAEASILRMLVFMDALSAVALNDHRARETLPDMLQVYACVTDVSPTVLALFKEAPDLLTSAGDHTQIASTTSMFDAMDGTFLRKRKKLSVAIWSMMEKVRASFLTNDCWQISPEVGGVHKTTKLMMNYIMLLQCQHNTLDFVLQEHHFSVFLSETEGLSPMVNLIVDMISCLERQLVNTSYSISDPGLRCIFLMNNCNFISQKVESMLLPSWTLTDQSKIQRYIETYLDVSWGPVMACLYDHMPYGLGRHSSVARFESEFQRTYAMQKLWKVPSPELRQRLRRAVIEKVISGYCKYLAERTMTGKSNRSPMNTPLELEELLKELFEG